MTEDTAPPQDVIRAFELDAKSIEPIDIGLINRSFFAVRDDGSTYVLQRLNPIFAPEVNTNIDRVTSHLSDRGLETPRLVRTSTGESHATVAGSHWRMLTRVEGETRESLTHDDQAKEAGRVLGEFHRALSDFNAPLAAPRKGVHDLERHLANLERALAAHTAHPAHAEVAKLAERIAAIVATLNPLPAVPDRIVHGDPKISNVVYRHERGICLVDLDTVAVGPVTFELGDALRSWCNPAGENAEHTEFLVERFRSSLEGYRQGAGTLLSATEWQAVPDAALTIATELAARFAADALEESFFAWDAKSFESASAHNLTRATGQCNLASEIGTALPTLRAVVVTLM